MSKLLVIEDDSTVRELLVEQLQKSAFVVQACASLAEARQVDLRNFSLIVLDWELGDGAGLDYLREIRAAGFQLPVIFLTARTDLSDKISGLELGADDYVTKPFELKELITRIRVRLRGKAAAKNESIRAGGIEMDLNQRTVKYEGQAVQLAKMEFELLKFFLENPLKALGRDEILNRVWGMENFPSSRTVDTHVAILRQKLKSAMFETLHGVGYRFRPDA